MPHSCFWTGGRILEFQKLGSKYPKKKKRESVLDMRGVRSTTS